MNNAGVLPNQLPYNLLKEITNGFSEKHKLGSGTYGKVYKGVHKDGETIAVKILYDMPGLDDEQFKEFDNLKSLKHQNIVRLVGFCHETQQESVEYNGRLVIADRIHRALCFEYMSKGSLQKHLYDEYNGLDWHTRYGIIKGICNGVKYLHVELETPMYHLDLKPANILLDKNMIPYIADFGLSRLFGEEQTRITKSSIGTCGYLPPEYIEKNLISNKFDVFSLGVITIKIIAGPTGYSDSAIMPSEDFIELVHANWRKRLREGDTPAPLLEPYSKQVKICIQIALGCVVADRDKRPTIGDIVDKLNATSLADPVSSMDQNNKLQNGGGQIQEEVGREMENCFGEVIDNYKLDKMARYKGKPKTREDREREALKREKENEKDREASRYVDSLKAMYGNGQSTLCLVYNATGDTLYLVANQDWYGYIDHAPYPRKIGNGQWAAFHHVHRSGEPSGSEAAVVYRGKNIDGQERDYLLAWRAPWAFWYRNKAYCEIGGVDYFQGCWGAMYDKLLNSDYSSNAKSDGCEIEAKIGPGDSPKFIARISFW